MSYYQAPVRDIQFVIENIADLESLARLPGFEDADPDTVASIVEEASKLAGDVLAVLESRDLAESRAAFHASHKRAELARVTYERELRLWKQKISSEQEYLDAEKALAEWQDESRPAIGEARWESPATTAPDPETGACLDNVSYSFAAQAVLLNVNMETGKVAVDRVIAAQDVGKAINPIKIEGQIEGAVIQALGWTLIEKFISEDGHALTDNLSTYLIPTVVDIPAHVESILIERPDPQGPYGVRGVGEIPFIPLAPAVIAAIKHATGIWFNQIPLTPEDVHRGIRESNSNRF